MQTMSNFSYAFVLFLLVGFLPAADPIVEYTGKLDRQEVMRDVDLVILTAPMITAVTDDRPAKIMGLRPGDRLVGINGLRVVGRGEWDLVRFCRQELTNDVQIAVLRNNELVELKSKIDLPMMMLGFAFETGNQQVRSALARIGFTVPESAGIACQPSPRTALSLLRWHAHREQDADTQWISKLAARFCALSEQRWADAAAMPPIEVPKDCPEGVRFERFLTAMAAYHAQGEQAPDPKYHGESLAYYVMNYPYPRVLLPPLGAFTHPDPEFMKLLADLRGSAVGEYSPDYNISGKAPEPVYSYKVRTAILKPSMFGGWPHRYNDLFDKKARLALLSSLQTQIKENELYADINRLALIPATLVDAIKSRRKDPLAEILPLMNELRTRSPLLGYVAANLVLNASDFWELGDFREQMRDHLEAGPLPDSDSPSLFLNHLRKHTASLDFHRVPSDFLIFRDQIYLVYTALNRQTPFAELHRQLAAPDVAKQPVERRRDLLAQMLDYVQDTCQASDVIAMSKLNVPGGLAMGMGQIAYWHARSKRDQSWLFPEENVMLRTYKEPTMIAALRAEKIPWHDREKTTRAVDDIQLLYGTPFTALLLAEECEAHARIDLAQSLRSQVLEAFARFDLLAKQQKFNRKIQRWFLEIRLMTCAAFPATAEQAMSAGERCQQLENKKDSWDSIALMRALAAITLHRTEQAVDLLCASFTANKQDPKPIFFTRNETFHDCRQFRSWILEQLVADQGFTNDLRQRLISATVSEQIDDTFVKLLGVPRKSLKGDGIATEANDF